MKQYFRGPDGCPQADQCFPTTPEMDIKEKEDTT